MTDTMINACQKKTTDEGKKVEKCIEKHEEESERKITKNKMVILSSWLNTSIDPILF